MRDAAEAGLADPFSGSDSEAVDELDALLREAVGLRMVADVPLGAFLSGGVDSSAVVALMQAQSSRPVKTFSIGFREAGYDEAPYRHARWPATSGRTTRSCTSRRKTRRPSSPPCRPSTTSRSPTPRRSRRFWSRSWRAAMCTVSLSGDGGDELFAGYNRYFAGRSLWDRVGWMPPGLRRAAAGALTAVPPRTTGRPDRADRSRCCRSSLRHGGRQQQGRQDRRHPAGGLPRRDVRDPGFALDEPRRDRAGGDGGEPPTALTATDRGRGLPDFTQRMMYLDLVTYLPDDILAKVDRASMGVSLEARVPLLDHRVVEFAWRLPLSLKMRDGQGKWLLRQVLYRYVPREMIERPKMGFGVPIDAWLRGPLRAWAEALLDERRLRDEGFFDPAPIRAKWAEHLSGRRNWQYHLWDVLMFQAWHEANAL